MKNEDISINSGMSKTEKFRMLLGLGKPTSIFFEITMESLVSRKRKESVFVNSSESREKCCRRLKISVPTFTQHLKLLEDKGFIRRVNKGVYTLDFDLSSKIREITESGEI